MANSKTTRLPTKIIFLKSFTSLSASVYKRMTVEHSLSMPKLDRLAALLENLFHGEFMDCLKNER